MYYGRKYVKSMKISLSHPTGNANTRALLNGLNHSGLLAEFYTTIACFDGDLLDKLSSVPFLKDFRRRKYASNLMHQTRSFPMIELMRMLALKLKLGKLIEHENGVFCIDEVYRSLDKDVARRLVNNTVDGVYAYEDGALETFKSAKETGKLCLYDLPIGYWRASRHLLLPEIEKLPDWAPTLTGFRDSDYKLSNKDKEIALADHIFVASSFTAQTLKDYYTDRLPPIHVIPYGFPDVNKKYTEVGKQVNRKLKMLFVGGLSQRKGIANLFQAIDGLENYVELTIVGHKAVDNCNALNKELLKHKWYPSLTHSDVITLMSSHDVFVFPSLFEGFGLVISEAMSQGTPVITTDRTAGGDFIKHGQNGWLVEAGSTESLKNQIEELLQNSDNINEIGRSAMETAEKRPWSVYSNEMSVMLTNIFNNDKC